MKIMVFDVPASESGALSILSDFYNEVRYYEDKKIHWYFVVSTPYFEETENIKILRFPWVKKSWLHRLYFDYLVAPKLVKRYSIDKIFSLQNVIIPDVKIPQILYVHQSLPFVEFKFSFIKNRPAWIYQNLIGKMILKSIKKSNKIIVQTEWMKKACVKKTEITPEKIVVVPPKININIHKHFLPTGESLRTFFYPASGTQYKNHKIIIEATKKIKNDGIKDYKVIFTLKGNENKYISGLFNEVKKDELPIEFVGKLSREQVFDLYTKSVLLFPSHIETFGLPLLEARLHKSVILASDTPFSHEILNGYKNAYFFNPFDSKKLADLMEKIMKREINYYYEESKNFKKLEKSLLDEIIQ